MIVNLFLREVLAGPVTSASIDDHTGQPVTGIAFTTKLPADFVSKMPVVYARHITGSEHNADLGTDYAAVTVDVYAPTEWLAAKIAEFVRDELKAAHRSQTVYPSGHIANYECPVVPFPFPRGDIAVDHDRYTAEYRLLIRPAA